LPIPNPAPTPVWSLGFSATPPKKGMAKNAWVRKLIAIAAGMIKQVELTGISLLIAMGWGCSIGAAFTGGLQTRSNKTTSR
jgi:hypothetical protein